MILWYRDFGRKDWQYQEITRETKCFYVIETYFFTLKIPKKNKPIIVNHINGIPIFRTYYTTEQKEKIDKGNN